MLKKFLVVFLLLMSVLSVVALAKDGPFPLLAAVGTWQTEANGAPKLFVQIDLGRRFDEGRSVQVFVVIRDVNGNVLARGSGVHPMNDPLLTVTMLDRSGQTVEATFAELDRPRQMGSKLPMSLMLNVQVRGTEGVESSHSYVLDR